MKAIIQKSLGHAELIDNQPIPTVHDDCILVKIKAVALNPIDWMKIDGFPAPGTAQGHDYSGTVEEVGRSVTKKFGKGDRVAGYIRACDVLQPDMGAFAEYAVAKGDFQIHIPDGVSFEDAASAGSGALTVGMGLYDRLGLAQPEEPLGQEAGEWILIYGGSTASAVLGIQLAKLSGYRVVSTCSARNAAFVKSLGAEEAFDYKDPSCGQDIRAYCSSSLRLVWDTVATPSSAQICAEALSPEGGRYCCLLPVEFPRSDVVAEFMDASTSFGEEYFYGPDKMRVPADPRAAERAKSWIEKFEQLWSKGLVRTHDVEVGEGGLVGVFDGLQRLRTKQVSAKKLVYRVDDTPKTIPSEG